MKSLEIKILIPIILIAATFYFAYGSPRVKYKGTEVVKNLTLPDKAGEWVGNDVEAQVNLGATSMFFLSSIKTKRYINMAKKAVVFVTMMDASNFHHPKVCFSGSGYTPEDLQDTPLEISTGTFNVPTIFFKKERENTLVMYWMSVDKKRVNWTEQKIKEFFNTLLGKKKTGLIVRLDILTTEAKINSAIAAARNLIKELSNEISPEQAEIIFGKQ